MFLATRPVIFLYFMNKWATFTPLSKSNPRKAICFEITHLQIQPVTLVCQIYDYFRITLKSEYYCQATRIFLVPTWHESENPRQPAAVVGTTVDRNLTYLSLVYTLVLGFSTFHKVRLLVCAAQARRKRQVEESLLC